MTSDLACPPLDWRGFPYAFGYFLRDYVRLGRRTRRLTSRARFEDLVRNKRTSPVAIDCGANVGKISELLLDAGYRVHAFEPEPMALVDLKARLNGRQNFILHEKAVGIAPGTATLFRHHDVMNNKKRTEASSLINQPQCDDRNTVVVEVASLPDYVESLGGRVGILKLDIEGYEVAILNAMLDRPAPKDRLRVGRNSRTLQSAVSLANREASRSHPSERDREHRSRSSLRLRASYARRQISGTELPRVDGNPCALRHSWLIARHENDRQTAVGDEFTPERPPLLYDTRERMRVRFEQVGIFHPRVSSL